MGARPADLVRTSAVVLFRVDYGEADRIVTLFTESHGKVSVLARSARASKRRFGAALEPFQVVSAAIAFGTGSLASLREASVVRGYPGILARLTSMQAASTAIERMRHVVPERAADPRVFFAVVELFERLERGEAERDVALAFELRVLSLTGLSPRFDACARCGKPRGDRPGMFAAGQGGLICRADGGGPLVLSTRALDAMQRAVGADWAEVRFGADLTAADEAVRQFVDWHVRHGRVQHP